MGTPFAMRPCAQCENQATPVQGGTQCALRTCMPKMGLKAPEQAAQVQGQNMHDSWLTFTTVTTIMTTTVAVTVTGARSTTLSVSLCARLILLDRQAMRQISQMCAMSCGAESSRMSLSGGRSRPAALTLPNLPNRSALKPKVLQQCKA